MTSLQSGLLVGFPFPPSAPHQQDGLHRADTIVLRAPVGAVIVEAFL